MVIDGIWRSELLNHIFTLIVIVRMTKEDWSHEKLERRSEIERRLVVRMIARNELIVFMLFSSI